MKTFVISRMYAGEYITDNIGGEIINLLYDDFGHNYLSIEPRGYISGMYNDTVKAVILTRLVKAGIFEVLGVGMIGEDGQIVKIKGSGSYEKHVKEARQQTRAYLTENKVEYAGINLAELTGSLTFRSDVLLLPEKQIYLVDSSNEGTTSLAQESVFYLKDIQHLPNQSLISYVTDEKSPLAFEAIEQMIRRDDLWDVNEKKQVNSDGSIEEHDNFLRIIRKEDDELVFSNLFYYFFSKHRELLIQFAKDILGVELSGKIEIHREMANIDLWMSDEKHIIVIENKIKSGINGVFYHHGSVKNDLMKSQLEKYYRYAIENKGTRDVSCFVFTPNYNQINLAYYSEGDKFKEIKYSELYAFFRGQNIEDPYYKEFVNALYKHTKDRAHDYAEEMAYRLMKKIRKIKKEQCSSEGDLL